MFVRALSILVLGLLLTSAAQTIPAAQAPGSAPAPTPEGLRETLQSRYPEIRIVDVQPTPVAGIFEIYTGASVVYATGSGDHLFVGPLIDTQTREDLSASSVEARNSIDFSSLPRDRAIKFVKGNGKREVAIFSDPDCPYCQQLEKAMTAVTDMTVYLYLYPIEELHPEAPVRARAIWCAKDPQAAWTAWMIQQKNPAAAGSECGGDPIDQLKQLGRTTLRINSTPTLFFSNGRRFAGTASATRLEQLLSAAAEASSEKPPVVGQSEGTPTAAR
jgi:thiol:disulfide interchange protein DsbC